MKIVFVGAGRLAFNLSKALAAAGHDVVQVYSRTRESAESMASVLGASAVVNVNELITDADVYIVAVKDSVLPTLIPQLCKGREQAVFLHTSGSIPMSVFQGEAHYYGVLYPLQTFSKEREVVFEDVPFFIEASDDNAMTITQTLAECLSSRVAHFSSEERRQIHLSAVFACNFVNHCYAMASDILAKHGLPFEYLLPLIDETARKVHDMSPHDAQTGPAVRYDENVIRSQSNMLCDNPFVKEIYDRMSVDIHRKCGLKE